MRHPHHHKIQRARSKSTFAVLNSISVFIGAVILNMIVPQLLLKYVYDANTLTEAPPIFEYLPLITYGLATIYFAYVLVTNYMRERSIVVLEKELEIAAASCSDCGCGSADGSCCSDPGQEDISNEELMELEKIVDEALKTKQQSGKQTVKKTKNAKKK